MPNLCNEIVFFVVCFGAKTQKLREQETESKGGCFGQVREENNWWMLKQTF